MNVLDARGRHVEAFYVELAAREDVGDGVEHAGQVFREYDDGKQLHAAILHGLLLSGSFANSRGCICMESHKLLVVC